MEYFFATFRVSQDLQGGFFVISRRTGRPEWVTKNSSNHSWTKEWVFVYGPELQDLPPFYPIEVRNFRAPGFTRAEQAAYDAFVAIQEGEQKWGRIHFESSEWIKANTGS